MICSMDSESHLNECNKKQKSNNSSFVTLNAHYYVTNIVQIHKLCGLHSVFNVLSQININKLWRNKMDTKPTENQ